MWVIVVDSFGIEYIVIMCGMNLVYKFVLVVM